MYLNKVILMGFLGGDAVVRTGKNNKQFTTLSLATKESRKNKETGKYNERTEWHNLIVFGKLAEFAAKLKKGTHLQIEGTIQHSGYKGVKTDTIRVTSILKLDRAERAAVEDELDEPSEEDVAA
jgi:single-strand DNA-binding protein